MKFASGTKLGPYEIYSAVGAGGMGEVYRARDHRLGRDVALKVLPAAFSYDPERLRRFEQEARAAAALNHPNILVVYDVGTESGAPYIVSELLEGETLRTRLCEAPLPVRRAIDCATQIARGLAAAHAKGILHRDLKPENIFLTRDGQVKILDFGLAKLVNPEPSSADTALTDSGRVVGTVGYTSPEQIRGKPADTRSDLFSLGAVLYEMLTGQRAFAGDTPADTFTAILTKDPPELRTTGGAVPPMLENIVHHCLEKQPEERFQSARDIVFDLQQCAMTSSSHLEARPAAQAFQWRVPLLAFAAFALIAGGLLLGWFWHTPKPSPKFHQLTSRRGTVSSARFLPDGKTVVYSAAWDGSKSTLYTTRTDIGGETSLGTDGEVLSISASGEMLVLRNPRRVFSFASVGELDRMPVSGGGPRPIADNVQDAVWGRDGSIAACRYLGQRYQLQYPLGTTLFETTGWLRAPRINPENGQLAFLFHPDLGDDYGSVAILDASGKMRELTPRFDRILGLAWAPSEKELWFSASEQLGKGGAIYAVDMRGNLRTLTTAPDNLVLLDAIPSGSVLLASLRATAHAMFSGPELAADRDLGVSIWSVPVDISGDGKSVVLDDQTTTPYTAILTNSGGSAPVRLGQAQALDISPDGHWVLALTQEAPQQHILLPTGAGEAKQLSHDLISREIFGTSWFPDSQRFVFNGIEPGHKRRGYVQDINGGTPRPLTPEGTVAGPVSPDGTHFITIDEKHTTFVQSFDGHSPPVKVDVAPHERVRDWLDSRHIYTWTPPFVSVVYTLDVDTGKREVLKRITIADPAGVVSVVPVTFAKDGKHFVYGIDRQLSDLHEVVGLQ